MTMYTGTQITETDDAEPIYNIFPLKETSELTSEQERDILDLVHEALRPLVESEWSKLCVTVARWVDQQADLSIVGSIDDEQAARDLVQDLKDFQVDVWASAYECLDEDAIWTRVVGPDAN